jgi:hypothetical protein
MDDMEVIEVLVENIEAQDKRSVHKILRYFTKTHKKRMDSLRNELVTLYCSKYASRNIWFLKEFTESLRNDEIKYACSLLSTETPNQRQWIVKPDARDVERLRHQYKTEHRQIIDVWRNSLQFESYCMLNILFDKLCLGAVRVDHVAEVFCLMNYFIHITPKSKMFVEKKEEDAIDVLWRCLLLFVTRGSVSEDIENFIAMSKDLFYYQVRPKNKKDRLPILFCCYHVCMNRRVKWDVLDVDHRMETEDLAGGKYLFVKLPMDAELIYQVSLEKQQRKSFHNHKKEVVLPNGSMVSAPKVNVVRHI